MRMRYPGLVFLAIISILAFGGSVAAKINAVDTPSPSIDPATFSALPEGGLGPSVAPSGDGALTPGLSGPAIECFNFNDNPGLNGGFLFIPPDPHCAAGLTHVINIGNCIIEWRPKNAPADVPQYRNSLKAFFTGALGAGGIGTLATTGFDPKVIYDQYSNRFIVVALEVLVGPPLQSRILVAVSKGADPNGGWWLHAINSMVPIGGVDRYADYPGLAVDDEAVYVTNNMFSAAGAYGGVRLWIINKAPTYAGPNGAIAYTLNDPYAASGQPGFATTTQPTHMYGPEPVGVGTYLVSYSGLSDGLNEYIDIIQVDNPLAVPVFTFFQLGPVGNIDNTAVGLPDAPQLGSAILVEVNDRRALNAVWRNNNLYMSSTVLPPAGADAGQTTAYWWRVNTIAMAVADQGNVGANDLGAGATYTFMASVMVDVCDNMAIGFAASNGSIYCGAYYATRLASDAPGSIGGTGTLAAGTDWYNRFFTGTRNRWGDYTGLSICPVDFATFWVYNEYACTRGTITNGTQDGRWCTKLGKFFVCQPVSVAITAFDAIAKDGAVELHSLFRSDLGVQAVNVYRSGAEGEFRLIETVATGGTSFKYTDDTVQPGATYRYQIGVVDGDGEVFSPVAKVSLAGVSVALGQNTPNPFNPSTTISFTLPSREQVTVSVYDANGRLVRTLLNESRDFGTHSVTWDGRDDAGSTVGSGVYFYRLTAGKYSESKKMVMLK
jgi:FlgD Ig-like domain